MIKEQYKPEESFQDSKVPPFEGNKVSLDPTAGEEDKVTKTQIQDNTFTTRIIHFLCRLCCSTKRSRLDDDDEIVRIDHSKYKSENHSRHSTFRCVIQENIYARVIHENYQEIITNKTKHVTLLEQSVSITEMMLDEGQTKVHRERVTARLTAKDIQNTIESIINRNNPESFGGSMNSSMASFENYCYSQDDIRQVVKEIMAEGQMKQVTMKSIGVGTTNQRRIKKKIQKCNAVVESSNREDKMLKPFNSKNGQVKYPGLACQLRKNRVQIMTDAEGNFHKNFVRQGDRELTAISMPQKPNLILKLYDLFTDFYHTDVKIEIGAEEFHCHLLILQIYSEYFERKVGLKSYCLPTKFVSPDAFAITYDWMMAGVSGIRQVNTENILAVYSAAKFLKIAVLEAQVWSIITHAEELTEETAYFLYMEAKNRKMPQVQALMVPRIRSFFLELIASVNFVELNQDDLCKFLSSDHIVTNCEMEVFFAAVRWISHNWKQRINHLFRVMSCVRFNHIDSMQLTSLVITSKNYELKYILQHPIINKMMNDGMTYFICNHMDVETKPSGSNQLRNDKVALLVSTPQRRMYQGFQKVYKSYREFLIYIHQHKQSIEQERKIKNREEREITFTLVKHDLPPSELLGHG